MENQNYNGWTNWSTWSAYNWLTHTEKLYLLCEKATNTSQLRRIWNLLLAGKDNIKPRDINFKEILKVIKDEL